MTQKKALLDIPKEKQVFLDVQPEFIDSNQPSTSVQVKTMPERFEQLLKKKPMKNVSKIKEFFKSCLALINDKDVVVELTTLIEETTDELRPEKELIISGKNGRQVENYE